MSLEGLKVVLEKEPVVGTPAAQRMLESPAEIESKYLHHVRSYVPLGRASESDSDSAGQSVNQYEDRLIRLVKTSKAPKGYITADYGFGKTSTCAFLWDRCRNANLLTVPPFQIEALDHLLIATYGWVRHVLSGSRPALVSRATEIYDRYRVATIERYAGGNQETMRVLEMEQRAGRYHLELTATDYIHFFEEMTALAIEAGYDGLVVLVDEVQQYIDPTIKAGVRDPIAPLFDLVQALVTRQGHLKFGLIFSIPKKELGVINDQRGDLVQRLKMDGLALDLSTIYDRDFASNLWQRLATQFDFEAEAPRVICPETLEALGEIAAREDLANGPRTVVSVFQLVCGRYLQHGGKTEPYTPIELTDSFMAGQISFDGMNKIQSAVVGALSSRVVKGNPERERAVRLLAAYPSDGATREVQIRYGLDIAVDDLANLAQGELIIFVGGGRDTSGREVPTGATLRGLERAQINIDWLQSTIREFHRGYYESSDLAMQRAAAGFAALLRERIFTPGWKVSEELEARFTQNRALVFEGSFNSTRKKYPARIIHARILADGDPSQDVDLRGDIVFDFVLERHLDIPEDKRRTLPGTVEAPAPGGGVNHKGRVVRFHLNLMHRSSQEIYRDLTTTLQPVVNPWKLTPLLMLSLYQNLEEKRAKGLIPKGEDDMIRNVFQPTLLDHCLEEIFITGVDKSSGMAGQRLVEDAFRKSCERIYPEYNTLMTNDQWRSALKEYGTALERLSTVYERRGEQPYESTKETLAAHFNRTNTGLDSFISSFGDLIEIVERWQGGQGQATKMGTVRFKMHPLETRTMSLLEGSTDSVNRSIGGRTMALRALPTVQVQRWAKTLGYRDPEIDAILTLLEKRHLIIHDDARGVILQAPQVAPSKEQYRTTLAHQQARVNLFVSLFTNDPMLNNWQKQHKAMQEELSRGAVDDQKLVTRTRTLDSYENGIDAFRGSKRAEIAGRISDLLRGFVAWNNDRYTALDRPPGSGLFSDQLDHQRQELLRQRGTIKIVHDQLRQEATGLVEAANNTSMTDSDLQARLREWGEIHKRYTTLQQDVQTFLAIYTNYRETAALLEAGIDLSIQIGDLGEPAIRLLRDLQAWATSIRGEMSSYKRKALEEVSTWKAQLADIKRQAEHIRIHTINQFNHTQGQLRMFLSEEMRIPDGQIFEPIVFNPLDPQGSHRKLFESAVQTIQRLSEQFAKAATRFESETHQALSSSSLAGMREQDRADVSQELTTVLAEVDALRLANTILGTVEPIVLQQYVAATVLNGPELGNGVIKSDEEHGEVGNLLSSFGACRDHAVTAAQRLNSIQKRMGEIALKPEEAVVYDIIRQIAASTTDVDLGQLAMHPAITDSKDQLWQMLATLYDKRRIRIKVLPIVD
ncbi:MAG: hypothetical protein ABI670_11270 [Chloroflexota bacterium]